MAQGLVSNPYTIGVYNQGATTPPGWALGIQPGYWAPFTLNVMNDVDPAANTTLNPGGGTPPWNGTTGFKSVPTLWTGGVIANNYSTHGAWMTSGGGHQGYYGSEVVGLDLGSQKFVRYTDPYIIQGGESYAQDWPTGAYTDGSQIPPHTYNGMQYFPNIRSYLSLCSYKNGFVPTPLNRGFLYNAETRTWRRTPENTIGNNKYSWSAYDKNRDCVWLTGPTTAGTNNGYIVRYANPHIETAPGEWGEYLNRSSSGSAYYGGIQYQAMQYLPDEDILVYNQFSSGGPTGIWAITISNNTAQSKILLALGGTPPPNLKNAQAWEWSQKRQSLLYFDYYTCDLYECKKPPNALTGTWMWSNLTDPLSPKPDPLPPNTFSVGGYNKFRTITWGSEEYGVVVTDYSKPGWAFRIP